MQVETTRSYDLLAVMGLTLAAVTVVLLDPWQPLRVVLGLPFVLFLPGYALVAALFPERHRRYEVAKGEEAQAEETVEEGIDALERTALSLGLSIAVVPLIGLGLNYTPWGIRLVPILVSLAAFVTLACATAEWRRRQVPDDERFRIAFTLTGPDWEEYSTLDKVLTVALAVSIVFAMGALGYVLTTPRTGERFTEFYILGPGGMATDYPTNLTANETGELILGVTNLEHRPANYTARMIDQPGRFVEDETGNRTFRPDGNRTLETWQPRLTHNETWERDVNFTLEEHGTHRIVFHLDAEHRDEEPYRRLQLFVNVTAEAS